MPVACPRTRGVLDDDPDDLAEAERHDGEVVAAQPQRGHARRGARRRAAVDHPADERAGRRRSASESATRAARRSGRRSQSAMVILAGGVGAHRHEAGVADRELAGEAVHHVERDGQDDVDAGGRSGRSASSPARRRPAASHEERRARSGRAATRSDERGARAPSHLLRRTRPKSPAGGRAGPGSAWRRRSPSR